MVTCRSKSYLPGLALLLALLWLRATACADSWQMSADAMDVDRQQAQARGSVQVNYNDVVMTADEVQANLTQRTLDAAGKVSFSQRDRLLSGDRLHYELDARRGWLTAARGRSGRLLFSGDRVDMSERKISARLGTFTTCDRPHPHYRMTASEILILDQRRVTLKGAQLWYRNRRLLRLPEISQPIPGRGVEAQGLVPRSGYASGDGLFAGLRYVWPLRGDIDASVELRATTGRGIRGIGLAERRQSWGTITLRASTKYDIGRERISSDDPRTGIRTLLVDALPELAVLTDRKPVSRWLIGQAHLSAGRYFERQTRTQAWRTAVTLFAASQQIPLARSVSVSPGLAWRGAAFGSHSQSVLVQRVTLQTGQTSRTRPRTVRLSFIRRTAHGQSPFLFDEVEIERELNADALFELSKGWRTEAVARYDLDRHNFRDVYLTVGRRVHCLDYSASWLKTRREFRVQVGLAGL